MQVPYKEVGIQGLAASLDFRAFLGYILVRINLVEDTDASGKSHSLDYILVVEWLCFLDHGREDTLVASLEQLLDRGLVDTLEVRAAPMLGHGRVDTSAADRNCLLARGLGGTVEAARQEGQRLDRKQAQNIAILVFLHQRDRKDPSYQDDY